MRVILPEPLPQTAVAGANASSGLNPVAFQAAQSTSAVSLPMQWSLALTPCALAALTATLLTSLGLNPFVAMLSVGFMAIAFYRQRNAGIAIKPAMGARLGAFAGLLWFVFSAVLQAILVTLLHKGTEIRNTVIDKLQQTAAGTSDPQVQAVLDYVKTPDGFVVMMLAGLVFVFFASVALGSIGGVLGGFFFGRRNRM